MYIECPECYTKTYVLEPPPLGKQYRCRQCGTVFYLPKTVATANGEKEKARTVVGKSRIVPRIILIAAISLLLLIYGGTSLAFAQPESALAAPFKGIATTMAEAASGAIHLIEEVRGVAALYERNIVSTALQSMRVEEGLKIVPTVTLPTNDMTNFPSPEYPLFPDYLDKQFSQFRYTVDTDGIISVDKSTATTDAFLKRIGQALDRLEGSQ